jgi:anti-anti-sigma factor
MAVSPTPRRAETRVLALRGAWDLARRDDLAALLFDVVKTTPQQVVLDLSEADLIDARSMAMIEQCAARLRSRGGDLSLVVSTRAIHLVLEAVGLTESVAVCASVEEAEALLRPAPAELT